MNVEIIVGFGDDSNEKLLEQFKSYIQDIDMVKAEWPLLRSSVFEM